MQVSKSKKTEDLALTPQEREFFIAAITPANLRGHAYDGGREKQRFAPHSEEYARGLVGYFARAGAEEGIRFSMITQAVTAVVPVEQKDLRSVVYRTLHEAFEQSQKRAHPKLSRVVALKDSHIVERSVAFGIGGALLGILVPSLQRARATADATRDPVVGQIAEQRVSDDIAKEGPLTAENISERYKRHKADALQETADKKLEGKWATDACSSTSAGVAGGLILAAIPNAVGAVAAGVLQKRRRKERAEADKSDTGEKTR